MNKEKIITCLIGLLALVIILTILTHVDRVSMILGMIAGYLLKALV